MWTGCVSVFTAGISMRAPASKVVVKPPSQKSGSQPSAGPVRSSPVHVGKLQGHWEELVPEGATADLGSEFPYELVKRALSDISMSTRGTELLGCETGNRLDSWQPTRQAAQNGQKGHRCHP